jgi:PTH1 family peptidyl-tRNA hydrolase
LLVVLGLGNNGEEYRGTRHNVGKEVVGTLAEKLRLRVSPGRGDYHHARAASKDLVLVIPTTYVNLSGLAAAEALSEFGAGVGDLLVVCDDFYLPLGTVRLRPQGSDGGHNGLASIVYELGSEEFGRLRIGVGPLPEGRDAGDFVLGRFEPSELEAIGRAKATASEAVLAVAAGGIVRAMNHYNKRSEPPEAQSAPGGEGPGGGA